MLASQKREHHVNATPSQSPPLSAALDVNLPQEWTY